MRIVGNAEMGSYPGAAAIRGRSIGERLQSLPLERESFAYHARAIPEQA